MAQCARCNSELPALTIGSASDLCRDCRAAEAATATPAGPRPVVTIALIAANVAVFAAMTARGVPVLDPTRDQLLAWGADYGGLSLGTQPWRMLTSVFVHVGLVHLALNMWALWNLGALAERIFDRRTIVVTYLLFGLSGSALSLWWRPRGVSAGASGAIFGIAGLLIGALYAGGAAAEKGRLRGVLRSLVSFAAYNLVIGFVVPAINNAAHIGGFLMGLACGAAMVRGLAPEPGAAARRRWSVVCGAVVLLAGGIAYVRGANDHVVRLERATHAFDRGAYGEAIADLSAASARLPDDAWVHAFLGASLLKADRLGEARAALERSIAIAPRYTYPRHLLGEVALREGRPADAVAIFTEVLRLDPKERNGRYDLGRALAEAGRPDEAMAVFEETARLDPADAAAHFALGFLRAQAGQLDAAIVSLVEALRLKPDLAEAAALLAKVYEAKGMPEEARAASLRAQELSKSAPAGAPAGEDR